MRIVKPFLLILGYLTLAILVGRGAYLGLNWPLWACQLIALPILLLGCFMAYATCPPDKE